MAVRVGVKAGAGVRFGVRLEVRVGVRVGVRGGVKVGVWGGVRVSMRVGMTVRVWGVRVGHVTRMPMPMPMQIYMPEVYTHAHALHPRAHHVHLGCLQLLEGVGARLMEQPERLVKFQVRT